MMQMRTGATEPFTLPFLPIIVELRDKYWYNSWKINTNRRSEKSSESKVHLGDGEEAEKKEHESKKGRKKERKKLCHVPRLSCNVA
jgi:hypothetical protein